MCDNVYTQESICYPYQRRMHNVYVHPRPAFYISEFCNTYSCMTRSVLSRDIAIWMFAKLWINLEPIKPWLGVQY